MNGCMFVPARNMMHLEQIKVGDTPAGFCRQAPCTSLEAHQYRIIYLLSRHQALHTLQLSRLLHLGATVGSGYRSYIRRPGRGTLGV